LHNRIRLRRQAVLDLPARESIVKPVKLVLCCSLLVASAICAEEQEIAVEFDTQTNGAPALATVAQPFRMRINLATGIAVINTRSQPGRAAGRYKLKVKGLPPRSTFTLKINGTDAGTITTDQAGGLRLGSLPGGIEADSITLMEFAEPNGTNALTISF
jgi:hypothetical protein